MKQSFLAEVALVGCVMICLLSVVQGHGRLLDPPSRSSVWRFKNDNELIKSAPNADKIAPNYNDNELFCGGAGVQQAQGGKCGVCGDSILDKQPRANEAGGTYGLGIISREYAPGSWIPVTVQITASHLGYFEFRLCAWNDPTSIVTQECLDENLLPTDKGYQYSGIDHPDYYQVQVKLPDDLTCSQCVLQWKYNTGNSWGCFGSDCGLGKGSQEQFYGCADVRIGAAGSQETSRTSTVGSSSSKPSTTPKTVTPATSTYGPRPSGLCKDVVYGQYYAYDCTRYYVCLQGYATPVVMKCPENLVYVETSHICDYPENVPPPCGSYH